jgi:hypothetical protein
MKSIRDTCIEFFQNEDIRQDMKTVIQPLGGMLYNEIYPYLWFLCIYHVFLTFLVLAILILLLRVLNHLGGVYLASSLDI